MGQLAGIVKLNDGQCHMDPISMEYTASSEQVSLKLTKTEAIQLRIFKSRKLYNDDPPPPPFRIIRTRGFHNSNHKIINCLMCKNVVSSSIGFACSSWNFLKRYDLVALSKIHVYKNVVTMIRPCCTDATICSTELYVVLVHRSFLYLNSRQRTRNHNSIFHLFPYEVNIHV